MPPAPSDSPVGRVRGPDGSPPPRDRNRKRNAPRPRRQTRSPQTSHVGPPPVPTAPHGGGRGKSAEIALEARARSPNDAARPSRPCSSTSAPRSRKVPPRAVAEAPRWQPTGVTPLDRLLGGGFPIGRLSEICGPTAASANARRDAVDLNTGRTAGRTAVAHLPRRRSTLERRPRGLDRPGRRLRPRLGARDDPRPRR